MLLKIFKFIINLIIFDPFYIFNLIIISIDFNDISRLTNYILIGKTLFILIIYEKNKI